jgi:hypothetical protein
MPLLPSARPTLSGHGLVEVRNLPGPFSPLGGSAGTKIPEEWVLRCRLLSVANCQANPNFKPFAAGGDGDAVQYCTSVHRTMRFFIALCVLTRSIGYVGYDPDRNTVIVAHEPTNFAQM